MEDGRDELHEYVLASMRHHSGAPTTYQEMLSALLFNSVTDEWQGEVFGVKNLLDRGASAHYGDAEGWTALRVAVENDTSEEAVRLLLRAGADIYRLDFLTGESPMDYVGSNEGIRRLMHRAADRRHCVWIAIVRKRAGSVGDVETLFSQRRLSKRHKEGRLSGDIKFLVRSAPVEVFRAVVDFL